MDAFRYSIALIFLLVLPPLLMFWIVVHPLINFWRKLGLRLTYTILITAMAAAAAILFLLRKSLLATDYGTSLPLLIAGTLCLGVSIYLRLQIRKKFSFAQIAGVPEIDPQGHPGELLTTGIYSHIRHPRYVQVMLGLAAGSLMANHLGSSLEEKELCQRFGAAYEEYRRKVPAFISGF